MSKPKIATDYYTASEMAAAIGLQSGSNIPRKLAGYGLHPKYVISLHGPCGKVSRLYTKAQRKRAVIARSKEVVRRQSGADLFTAKTCTTREQREGAFIVDRCKGVAV